MFPKDAFPLFQAIIEPWYKSLKTPHEAQKKVLIHLANEYAKTHYGMSRKAGEIEDITDFRTNFPIITYNDLNPYLAEIQKGNHRVLLPEPLTCWVMTRGSTGPAKVLPATKTHLEQIFRCGARALVNYMLRKKEFDLLTGYILNLNFPSTIHTMVQGKNTVTYGYSSGTYAKLNPMLRDVSLLPKQEEIDSLGPGISKGDWERRFELTYRRTMNQNVIAAMGVTPVILSFAKYLWKKHGTTPKELWNFQALFCTSVRKIPFKYAPILRKYFGPVPVIEIYSATEGVFAQQLDERPYVTPNYDAYLFEVVIGSRKKMLHEMKRGEWGKLIISSSMFPRYDIGDLIEAAGNNYFRVIGRYNPLTLLEHKLYRVLFGWFL